MLRNTMRLEKQEREQTREDTRDKNIPRHLKKQTLRLVIVT